MKALPRTETCPTSPRAFLVAAACFATVACGGVDEDKPRDAGVDATVDAAADAAVDAGEELLDASVDAGQDAAPPPDPPVTNGQSADLVLGQPDFESTAAAMGYGGLSKPTGLSAYEQHLWVGDSGNDRVLQWNGLPANRGEPAALVVGQPGPDAHDTGPTDVILGQAPTPNFISLAGLGTRLLVSDGAGFRALIWTRLPFGDGAPANLVLGQASFTDSEEAISADRLRPGGIWSDGTRVVIGHRNAHRVLIWNHFPVDNGQAADLVLGQLAFDTADRAEPPTASSMSTPSSVFFDGERLWVSDLGNNRVLVWNSFPEQNGAPADYVVGQHDLTTGAPNAGGPVGPMGMDGPRAVLVAHGSLFVTDAANRRVLVFTPPPSESGVEASAVLGQPDFETVADLPPSDANIGSPDGLAVSGDSLFVADRDWNRVLRFALRR